MMMIDLRCPKCGCTVIDWLRGDNEELPLCGVGEGCPEPACGTRMERVHLGKTGAVHQDSIEGGIWMKNGLCNEDGTPRRYDSKTEINREAKRRGLVNLVTHETDYRQGTDKNKHTSRWV